MPAETSVTAKLLEVIPETPDVQTLRLERPFDFKAGQAVQLTLPNDPKKRFYSISSSPTENNRLDLTIQSQQGSPLYTSIFALKIGSPVGVAGPLGKFSLPETLEGPCYFLAGGSGVTPFRSMIKYLLDTRPTTPMWLFYSVRTPDDIIFKDQLLAWSQNPTFRFVPTFTRTTEFDIEGETGRIGDVLLRKHLKVLEGTFFICGPKEFVTDMEHTLIRMGVTPAHIRRENW